MFRGLRTTGGQLAPLESELHVIQTKVPFMAALLLNVGFGGCVAMAQVSESVQLFPGLLATAPCNYHIKCLVTGPIQLAFGTAL